MNNHLCVAEESSWGLTSCWTPELPESRDSEFSLPRRGGGVNACLIRTDASLNIWVRVSWWSWNESKSGIQIWPRDKRWPWCWPQPCWYTFERTSWAWLLLTSSLTSLIAAIFSTPEQYLWTWDKLGSLKRLSFGRCWPRTAAWTNFVSTSDGLRWVRAFSSDMNLSLRMSWNHTCLSSMFFDFLEMPRHEAIVFPAEESVLTMILISLERIADLKSWMKCLIASDSTDAWVIAYNSASADETKHWCLCSTCWSDVDQEYSD